MLLPFFFASNRTVYARYMPYLTLQMSRLPDEIRKIFNDGQFVAKLTNDKFNSVWIDYVLEVTENKALKSSGGVIGLTHQDNALGRWFLARPVTAKYSMTFNRDIAGKPQKDSSKLKQHSDTVASKAKYNENVSKMVLLFDDVFIDPFKISDAQPGLVNFATGVTASSETEHSLLNALDTGFIKERFVIPEGNSAPSKSFYEPLPKCNIKTMKSSKQTVKCKSKEIAINGEEMYLRLLAINAYKQVPLKQVPCENATIPLSLFTDDGEMISPTKSIFMHKLEEKVSQEITTSVKNVDCILFDGMAVIQMLQPETSKKTYRDMANMSWKYIMSTSKGIQKVNVVFDR